MVIKSKTELTEVKIEAYRDEKEFLDMNHAPGETMPMICLGLRPN